MTIPDIERLRRFALLAALLLVSYSAAGIRIEAGEKITLLGVPVIVSSPNLLSLGFILLSIYGLLRFFYYGLMLSSSPYRNRRDLLHALHAEGGHGSYQGSVFFGPCKFSTTPLVNDKSVVEAQIDLLLAAFPKIGNRRPKTEFKALELVDENGEPYVVWNAEITIPLSSRLAAFAQDVDYTAPVWTNLCALVVFIVRLVILGAYF